MNDTTEQALVTFLLAYLFVGCSALIGLDLVFNRGVNRKISFAEVSKIILGWPYYVCYTIKILVQDLIYKFKNKK